MPREPYRRLFHHLSVTTFRAGVTAGPVLSADQLRVVGSTARDGKRTVAPADACLFEMHRMPASNARIVVASCRVQHVPFRALAVCQNARSTMPARCGPDAPQITSRDTERLLP